VRAQFTLATCYRKGDGVDQDDDLTLEWYIKVAEQGHVLSMYGLGQFYYHNDDPPEAAKWLLKAAELGHVDAQCGVGMYYYMIRNNEEGAAAKAFEWSKKAGDAKHPTGQYNVGRCYEEGVGVEKDFAEAVKWYKRAAAQRDELALRALKRLDIK
jgi:TPR repeat protein